MERQTTGVGKKCLGPWYRSDTLEKGEEKEGGLGMKRLKLTAMKLPWDCNKVSVRPMGSARGEAVCYRSPTLSIQGQLITLTKFTHWTLTVAWGEFGLKWMLRLILEVWLLKAVIQLFLDFLWGISEWYMPMATQHQTFWCL